MFLQLVMNQLGFHELLPYTPLYSQVAKILCHDGSDYQELCAYLYFFLGGIDSPQFDRVSIGALDIYIIDATLYLFIYAFMYVSIKLTN